MNQSTASCVNLRERCFVRLACVKHAASVHPEPGSNSHVKVCIAQKLAWLIILFDYCCFVRNELNRVLVSFLSNVLVRKIIFIIFQGCFTVQLSRFLESVLIPFAVRLCGISSRFQLLSPSMRHVTHALLPRPPLSHLK